MSRYNTFSYSVNEGLLQSTMGDIAFDKNNFCWLSFPNGIQKFDGNSFITIPVQPGLPDDKLTSFFQCKNGELLISHARGISKYDIASNKFQQVYTLPADNKNAALFIGEDENVIYFYLETGLITGINGETFAVISETKTGFWDYSSNYDYRPKIGKNIIKHRAALLINSSIYLWDLANKKIVLETGPIKGISPYLLLLKSENEVLYYLYEPAGTLQLHDLSSNIIKPLPIKGATGKNLSRCNIFHWQNKIVLSLNDRLYETDSTLTVLKAEIVNFQNQPVSANTTIGDIKEDNFGNLYLHTVTGGIKKIIRNNYPVKYLSTGSPGGNFILSILPDKINNRILAGASANGLLVFDTLQRLVKHVKITDSRGFLISPNVIIKTNNGDYLLFASGQKRVWLINKDLSHFSSLPIITSLTAEKSGASYFGNLLYQNEQEAVVQTQDNIYSINLTTLTVHEQQFAAGYIMSGLHYPPYIISHGNDELIFLDATTLKEVKKIPFKNTAYVRCFATGKQGTIYIGSNKGIFIIDSAGTILQQLNRDNGLPDECIYAMTFDTDGFLWCSTNKGILKIDKNNVVLQLKKEDGLQENEFNTNMVAKTEDGELFFGGVNGLNSFYPSGISTYEEKLTLLFTKIKANNEDAIKDTAAWNISRVVLPYMQNALSFDFIAAGNNNPDQYIYQYRMDGVDNEWIQNSNMQTVRYSLPPGRYTFKIYASRSFNKDAKSMKELLIIIKPPFWKTWWFLSAAAILFISLLAYFINAKNRRKYDKKLQRLENERQLKQERERISKDLHDSLGAYANAVLYNTELLEKENTEEKRKQLIGDLKFASKDIITSLRETVWALKKENYTAEECFVRIRNFIQPLTRYYTNIHFQINGDAPLQLELPYTKALNLVRIVQEAVSNSIKHAGPGNIIVSSIVAENNWQIIVADDGKGFNYEVAKKAEGGNGLGNMQQRAAESGFEFTTESLENKGTTITITV